MRALICGGRDFGNILSLEKFKAPALYLRRIEQQCFQIMYLNSYHSHDPITHVIEGGATGADRTGQSWAIANGIDFDTYEAQWKINGNAAGAMRNVVMAVDGKPDVVIAFPGGRGTAHMIETAKSLKIPVIEVMFKSNL